MEELRTRLIGRGTDDPEGVERRLRVAAEELQAQPEFGHVVVNDRLQDALEQLTAIVAAELGGRALMKGRRRGAGPPPSTTLGGQPGKAQTK